MADLAPVLRKIIKAFRTPGELIELPGAIYEAERLLKQVDEEAAAKAKAIAEHDKRMTAYLRDAPRAREW